jgi:hypothetical protein
MIRQRTFRLLKLSTSQRLNKRLISCHERRKALLLLTSLLVAILAYGQSAKSSAVGDNT